MEEYGILEVMSLRGGFGAQLRIVQTEHKNI